MFPTNITRLDVRPIDAKDRFELITSTYHSLPEGGTLDLVLDHDPKCLYYTLEATEPPGAFRFVYREEGPEVWRVEVRKQLAPREAELTS